MDLLSSVDPMYNTEVFSPIRNFDDVITKRKSDSFSEFLKGPEFFKKAPELLDNVDENTPVENNSSKKLSKTHQKKSAKKETRKTEDLRSSASTNNSLFVTSSEERSSLNKEKSKNLYLTTKKNKDVAINFITKRDNVLKSNPRDEVESNKSKHSSHSVKESGIDLLKNSLQSGAASVPESKDLEKTDKPFLVSHHNPLTQIQSGVFEKLINDAVDSRFDEMQQLMYSQHHHLQKIIHSYVEKMERRHASEQETMFKVIEALLEENRSLRNAILASR